AGRHHYGQTYDENRRPSTKLEWVVAIADKIAVMDRAMRVPKTHSMAQALRWLEGEMIDQDREKKNIKDLREFLETKDRIVHGNKSGNQDIDLLLNLDWDLMKSINNKLLPENLLSIFNLPRNASLKIALYLCEGKGIQEFIRRSDAMKYLTGASSLVAAAFEMFREEISGYLAPESVIYSSSGSLLALVPSRGVDEINKKIWERYKKTIPQGSGIKLSSPALAFGPFEIKHGPLYSMDLDPDHRCFGELFSVVASALIEKQELAPFGKIKLGDLCTICNQRAATTRKVVVNNEEKLCTTCDAIYEHEIGLKRQVPKSLIISCFGDSVSVSLPGVPARKMFAMTPAWRFMKKINDVLLDKLRFKDLSTQLEGKTITFIFPQSIDGLG
nr:hypothetical protein [Candidatus Sigynarchaeota archaeon]